MLRLLLTLFPVVMLCGNHVVGSPADPNHALTATAVGNAQPEIASDEPEIDPLAPLGKDEAAVLIEAREDRFQKPPLLRGGRVELRPDVVFSHTINNATHYHKATAWNRMSADLSLLLLMSLVGGQMLLGAWRAWHPLSFNRLCLLGLWLIPVLYSMHDGVWLFRQFLCTWLLWTLTTGLMMWRASVRPIAKTTPRVVYKWFRISYSGSQVLCWVGVMVVCLKAYDISFYFDHTAFLLFYGLYFGMLGRMCATLCAERMAISVGYYTHQKGLPNRRLGDNTCAICDSDLFASVRLDKPHPTEEKVFTLTCGHRYHESCIRGWTLIGKRDTCAYCSEKVQLRQLFTHVWDKPHHLWANMMDSLLFLVVLSPLLLLILNGGLWYIEWQTLDLRAHNATDIISNKSPPT